jgi:hypothetical protein
MHSENGQAGLTKKQFWTEAYLAALHRLSAKDALQEANDALEICDERWKNPESVGHWQWKHDFPIGHSFSPFTRE